jgi:hypothetical protein
MRSLYAFLWTSISILKENLYSAVTEIFLFYISPLISAEAVCFVIIVSTHRIYLSYRIWRVWFPSILVWRPFRHPGDRRRRLTYLPCVYTRELDVDQRVQDYIDTLPDDITGASVTSASEGEAEVDCDLPQNDEDLNRITLYHKNGCGCKKTALNS